VKWAEMHNQVIEFVTPVMGKPTTMRGIATMRLDDDIHFMIEVDPKVLYIRSFEDTDWHVVNPDAES